MKKQLLTWCAALLSAGMLCAQDTVRTVQGIPHPNGQYAAPRQAASTKTRALAAPANGFTMDDIEYWIGEGSKRALFAVQWNDPRETHALVWGYNFDGDKYGVDLVRDIAAADPAFYAMIQFTGSMGFTICGLGYDRDGDGEIALRNKETGEMLYPDEPGIFINTNGYDYDNYEVADADDYWGAGWYILVVLGGRWRRRLRIQQSWRQQPQTFRRELGRMELCPQHEYEFFQAFQPRTCTRIHKRNAVFSFR